MSVITPALTLSIAVQADVWEEGIGQYGACWGSTEKARKYATNERYGALAEKLCSPGKVVDYKPSTHCVPCGDPSLTKCRKHFKVLCK